MKYTKETKPEKAEKSKENTQKPQTSKTPKCSGDDLFINIYTYKYIGINMAEVSPISHTIVQYFFLIGAIVQYLIDPNHST